LFVLNHTHTHTHTRTHVYISELSETCCSNNLYKIFLPQVNTRVYSKFAVNLGSCIRDSAVAGTGVSTKRQVTCTASELVLLQV